MATLSERANAIVEEAREAGRAAGRAEAAQEFYGNSVAILSAHLLADAAQSMSTRLASHNPEFAAKAQEWSDMMRLYATPASVQSVDPAADATGIAADAAVNATFVRSIDPATLTAETFYIAPASGGSALQASIAYDDASRTATLTPENPLSAGVTYRMTIGAAVRALGGQALGSDYEWVFTVAA